MVDDRVSLLVTLTVTLRWKIKKNSHMTNNVVMTFVQGLPCLDAKLRMHESSKRPRPLGFHFGCDTVYAALNINWTVQRKAHIGRV